MHHNKCADNTGGKSPGCLVYIFQRIIFIGKCHIKRSGKTISKVVAGSALKRFAVMHQSFNRKRCFCTGKLFFICFTAFDHRDCQILLAEICINVQHLDRSFLCLLSSRMDSMSFLP